MFCLVYRYRQVLNYLAHSEHTTDWCLSLPSPGGVDIAVVDVGGTVHVYICVYLLEN